VKISICVEDGGRSAWMETQDGTNWHGKHLGEVVDVTGSPNFVVAECLRKFHEHYQGKAAVVGKLAWELESA
jgi:hypothetical protein